MTLQQQAYGLIDRLPEDSVQVIILVMKKMLPLEHENEKKSALSYDQVTPKMKAYLRMQELRNETARYDISEAQREAAVNEKFGTFG